MTENELFSLIGSIRPADSAAAELARARQAALAKPPGSLGKLETISIRLAGITGRVKNELEACRVLVFAADNGVCDEGIAVTPRSVTLKQAINMTKHITGMSALAKYFNNSVAVYDVGIDSDIEHDGIINRKLRRGTRNMLKENALTREETLEAVRIGIEAVREAKRDGVQAVGIGEMGIGNTTTSAAVLAALTGCSAELATGRGSGLDDAAFENKKRVVSKALELRRPDRSDPLDALTKVGGFDLAAMTGAYIGCALTRMPAVADGFISVVAALCAVRLCRDIRDFIFLSHASAEPGYRLAAEELGLEPFLYLDMRLGEGSGCPLAFEIMRGACAAMNSMATFSEAAIDAKYLDAIKKG